MKWSEGFMGMSPALRIARLSVQVGVAQSPARATPTKVAAGLIIPLRTCRHTFFGLSA
jgi:hypothetical protein